MRGEFDISIIDEWCSDDDAFKAILHEKIDDLRKEFDHLFLFSGHQYIAPGIFLFLWMPLLWPLVLFGCTLLSECLGFSTRDWQWSMILCIGGGGSFIVVAGLCVQSVAGFKTFFDNSIPSLIQRWQSEAAEDREAGRVPLAYESSEPTFNETTALLTTSEVRQTDTHRVTTWTTGPVPMKQVHEIYIKIRRVGDSSPPQHVFGEGSILVGNIF